MQKVRVKLRKNVDCSYSILIEKGLLGRIPSLLNKNPVGERYAIICDSLTANLFGKPLLKRFNKSRINATLFSFPSGEKSKSLSVLSKLQNRMLEKGFDRNSAIIALGGGVTGDLAGFVAATYMRGIPYIQVPTTLLAMVDSSIGGKVAVDLPRGKNSCGAFHQPKAVFIDLNCLKTLPQKQLSNGLAEIVKHAIIADAKLFTFLENDREKILRKDLAVLGRVIKKNCEIKARIVERDELERNLRKVVNYGHTVGHALEVLGKYKRFSHGEAISIGMAAEAMISHYLGFLSLGAVERQNRLLEGFGLPTALPNYSATKIIAIMRHDKKSEKGKLVFVLPSSIGKMKTINGKYAIQVDGKMVGMVLRGLQ